ncbi:MAG: hypothetical protein AAGM38_14450, partial [Pseudomonadota bacterium]
KVLNAALRVAVRDGFVGVKRDVVAREARVGKATVSYAFGDLPLLRNAVVEHAMKHQQWKVVGEALVAQNGRAKRLSDAEKHRAYASLN